MKKFLALLKVGVKSMLLTSAGTGTRKKRRAVSGLGALLLIAFLALYLSCYFSGMLLSALAPLGMESLVFVFMGIAALLGGLLFTTMAVRSTVFGGKDNDLLLSLPVSSTALMASRVVAIYLENLLFAFFMLVPAGVICSFLTQSGVGHTVGFWARVLLAALTLPLLDTALSVLLGAGLAWLSTKVTKKAIGQNILMGLYLAVVFYFSFNINSMLQNLAANAQGIKASLGWARPLIWLGDGIVGDWISLLLFAAACIVPFVLMLLILGKVYRKAVTAFSGQTARSDYRLSRQRASGQSKALIAKEARRFFGTPVYFWNAGLGLFMAVAAGVVSLFQGELLRRLVQELGESAALALSCAVVGFCLSTCAISAFSISLEGQSFWILREAPISEGRLLRIKTGFQLIVALPCILICTVCLSVALRSSVGFFLGLLCFSLAFEVGHACFGMLMGLTFPRLDAANDAAVVKQSMLSFLSIFAPMAFLGAAGALWGICSSFVGAAAATAAALLFVVLLSALAAVLLIRKGVRMFCHLSN